MGVWIETAKFCELDKKVYVTPCVGVWIETIFVKEKGDSVLSHPAWVCGLKPAKRHNPFDETKVTPCVGVWIETN